MSRKLTASDRKALIRLASKMEKGSEERKAILKGLKVTAAVDDPLSLGKMLSAAVRRVVDEEDLDFAYDRRLRVYEGLAGELKRLGYAIQNRDNLGETHTDWKGEVHVFSKEIADLHKEIDMSLKYLRRVNVEMHKDAKVIKEMADTFDLVAKRLR